MTEEITIETCSVDGKNALFNSNGAYCRAFVTRVVDGDTFVCNIENPAWNTGPLQFKVRLAVADTPETYRPKDEEERAAGQRATDYVRSLIERKHVEMQLCGVGNFGRPLVKVRCVDGDCVIEDLDTHLIENGYAEAYKR